MRDIVSPLGKKSVYIDKYDSDLIFLIERSVKREEIGISREQKLPFYGYDIINAYEISWLSPNGKPEVSIAEVIYPCSSKYLLESKSLKLYLNSFNNTIFNSANHVRKTIEYDLSNKLKVKVFVRFLSVHNRVESFVLEGQNIDEAYSNNFIHPAITILSDVTVKNEVIYSHLLKSNCPVTFQPDWGTLIVTYSGPKINYCSFLHYIISLRNLNEFHEQCIEKIYMEIYRSYNPESLEVYGRYSRRGGIDINPYRSTKDNKVPKNHRTSRQ